MPIQNQSHASLAPALLGAMTLIGCGGAPGTTPDDMSAAEHRQAAEEHDREAEHHASQYDPEAATQQQSDIADFIVDVYNPTAAHESAAAHHADVASQHRRAAATLEAFEESECGSFPASTRRLCPLLGQLAGVENVENGVRFEFRDDVNTDAVHAHIACHVAFARARGREGMDHCPMYVEGARAVRDDAGRTMLVTDTPAAIESLQRRAAAHLDPDP